MRRIGRVACGVLAATLLALAAMSGARATHDSGSPGPRPDRALRSVMVPTLGAVLAVEDNEPSSAATTVWSYDLIKRRWSRFGLAPTGQVAVGRLVYLAERDEVYSVSGSASAMGALDLGTREWRSVQVSTPRPVDVTDVVVDTRRGNVLAWSDWLDELWTYDPESNRWTRVPRSRPWPSASWGDGGGYTLMTFDGTADRAVLAVIPVAGRRGGTWLFDPETLRWTRTRATPPTLNYGFGEMFTNAVYDTAHQRTVLFSYGDVATYDSAGDSWDRPSPESWPGHFIRMDHQLVFDPVSARVLVVGGSALVHRQGVQAPYDYAWQPVREVWAYDVGFNTWTRLTGT